LDEHSKQGRPTLKLWTVCSSLLFAKLTVLSGSNCEAVQRNGHDSCTLETSMATLMSSPTTLAFSALVSMFLGLFATICLIQVFDHYRK
jgi:hypothetical protein